MSYDTWDSGSCCCCVCILKLYPRVKVRSAEIDGDDEFEHSIILQQDFSYFSLVDYSLDNEHKDQPIAKVPRSYFQQSITPPALPKVVNKSEQQAENRGKQHVRASSIQRPRAVISSPDNDQMLGNIIKTRLERSSALRNQNTARQSIHLAQSKPNSKTDIANKGKKGSSVDIRVPRANIVKAKPCFTVT